MRNTHRWKIGEAFERLPEAVTVWTGGTSAFGMSSCLVDLPPSPSLLIEGGAIFGHDAFGATTSQGTIWIVWWRCPRRTRYVSKSSRSIVNTRLEPSASAAATIDAAARSIGRSA